MRQRLLRLNAEHAREAAVVLDPCLPYVEAQERSLDQSLSHLLNNMERRRSLYQLPWYLVLGEENAGKTSLVTRSNQSFSLSHINRTGARAQPEEKLAYAIDWWIGDEAVLIDPPGELLTQQKPLTEEQRAEQAQEPVAAKGKVRPVLPGDTHPRHSEAQQLLKTRQSQLKQLEQQHTWLKTLRELQEQQQSAAEQLQQAQAQWDGQAEQRQTLELLEQLAPQRHQFTRLAELDTQLSPLAEQIAGLMLIFAGSCCPHPDNKNTRQTGTARDKAWRKQGKRCSSGRSKSSRATAG